MTKFLTTCAVAALALPAASFADVTTGGEVYLGYGNLGIQGDGILSEVSTFVAGDHTLDNGFVLEFKAEATLRSHQSEIGGLDDDNIDLSMSLDMQSAGKLSFTTFNESGYPWATGEIKDRGSYAVFPTVRKAYQPVFDTATIGGVVTDREMMFKYENRFGKLGFELITDPTRTFGSTTDLDDDEIPTSEIKLTYPTEFGIYSIEANDIKDVRAQVVLPLPKAGVTLIANHEWHGESDRTRTRLTGIYRAKNMGAFKGVFLTHGFDQDDNNKTILSTNWGGDKWNLKVAADSDGDYALEAGYQITDSLSLLAGYDSGYENTGFIGDGHDPAASPPASAPARDEAFEIGLKLTF
ncbi:hypothetical protein EDD53_1130 [Pacificibacter maritimus]|uniref:Porin domain-containing protein n=1 Tax=Pacificibacter maritimus TaxID=762213 RepID=A0A3N4UNH5_9RHOB|nr:hypothetical protein [Pacificibacter maritimus]RPE71993.1 hypothetical protein EDD53_1130 [Pacificibacter maritimus]